jgi:hypothetical protein
MSQLTIAVSRVEEPRKIRAYIWSRITLFSTQQKGPITALFAYLNKFLKIHNIPI